jgi:hypothetical protein
MTKRLVYICMMCGIMVAAGCDYGPPTDPIERSDLFGRYVGDFGETDVNYFDLYKDSTFISYYKCRDDRLYVDTGTWRFGKFRTQTTVDYWLDMYGFDPSCDDSRQGASTGGSKMKRLILSKGSRSIAVEYSFRLQQYYIKKLK